MPIVKKVKRPTILLPREQARNIPVSNNHVHHSEVNSLAKLSKTREEMWSDGSLVTKLAESDIGIYGQSNKEDQLSVEEDKAALSDMCIVYYCSEVFILLKSLLSF